MNEGVPVAVSKGKHIVFIFILALGLARLAWAAPDLGKLERTAEANPKDPQAWFNVGVVAHMTKDLAKAEKALAKSVKLAPKDAEAWELYGTVLLEEKKSPEAGDAFGRALELDKKRLVAWQGSAQAAIAENNAEGWRKAAEAYGQAARLKPADGRLVLNQGVLLAKLGEDAKAAGLLEKAAGLKGGEAASRSLCILYNKAGDAKKAAAACGKAVQADDVNAETWYNLGFAKQRLGEGEAAKKAFEKALKADPNHAPSLYNLGFIDYEAGQADEALKRFQAAIKAKQGNYPEAEYNAGVVLGDLGRWEDAASLYRDLLKKDPGNEDAQANLDFVADAGGRALLDEGRDAYVKGDFDVARKAWQRALKLDPKNSEAASLLETVKAKDEKTKAAAAARQSVQKDVAKRLKAEDAKVRNQGLAALKAGKASEAARLLSFYLKKNPSDKEASKALFKARAISRQKIDGLLQDAARALVDGDKAKARQLAKQAADMDPDNTRAQKLLSQAGEEGPKPPAEQLRKDYYAGVELYLKGDLTGAVATWKKVLAADPGHLDSRRSLAQAELELTALKKRKG
jgi:tetratricopeptide (TPR) repeat protein